MPGLAKVQCRKWLIPGVFVAGAKKWRRRGDGYWLIIKKGSTFMQHQNGMKLSSNEALIHQLMITVIEMLRDVTVYSNWIYNLQDVATIMGSPYSSIHYQQLTNQDQRYALQPSMSWVPRDRPKHKALVHTYFPKSTSLDN